MFTLTGEAKMFYFFVRLLIDLSETTICSLDRYHNTSKNRMFKRQ